MSQRKSPLRQVCDQAIAHLKDAIRDIETIRDGRAAHARFYGASHSTYAADRIMRNVEKAFEAATDYGPDGPRGDFVEVYLRRATAARQLTSTSIEPSGLF